MSGAMRRSRPQGRAHRALLRRLILPMLYAGARVPTGMFLSRLLHVSDSCAARHMRQVLAEDGYVTEQRRGKLGCRVFVVATPEGAP